MDYRDPDWVAEKLGLDKNTLYRFLQDGTIPALQLGRKWLISERKLAEWLEQETEKQTRSRRGAQPAPELARRLDDYTAAARQVLKRAHSEARRYAHEKLDTAHLLLAIASDGASAAGRAARDLGVSADAIRSAIEQRLIPGPHPAARRLPRTPEAKRAMRLAAKLARKQSPDDPAAPAPVGTDHLLTGVLLARRGLGAEILTRQGVTRRRLKQALAAAALLRAKPPRIKEQRP